MKTVLVKCKTCGKEFTARIADRNRGWARFCSKRCKAIKQERRTGQYKKYLKRRPWGGEPEGFQDVYGIT